MARIDVRGDKQLQAIILALKSSDREVRSAMRSFTKARIVKPWMSELLEASHTRLERLTIGATATVAVSDQNIRIQAATKGRKLSGGFVPKVDYPGVEFGANHQKVRYMRKGHPVRRNTTAQLRPRNRRGYVFYPTAKRMIPRLASLWVQTVVKTYADIFEGKS